MNRALITGITGQDGALLAELLLNKGYEVHGLVRRASTNNRERIDHLRADRRHNGRFHLHYGDVTDATSLWRAVSAARPDEVYNLAGQSHVKVSFETPEYTTETNALGILRLLEAIQAVGLETRIYQASTSEMFGVSAPPQMETTPFAPVSPYAIAKLYAHNIVGMYREAYNIHASCGILFNHESRHRHPSFVTRKVAIHVARYAAGDRAVLELGCLDAKRDWGHALDYVDAMWRMLQQDAPDDYVIATGETHTVREFVTAAFDEIGIEIDWVGDRLNEAGIDRHSGDVLVIVNPDYFRPIEVNALCGDPSKARKVLGWEPRCRFIDVVRDMVGAELAQRIDR